MGKPPSYALATLEQPDDAELGTAPNARVPLRYPGAAAATTYGVPDPVVGDQVTAVLVLTPDATFDPEDFPIRRIHP